MGRRVTRWLGRGLLGVVGLVAIWLISAAIAYSPTYVMRVLTMRESSQADYLERFPTRTLTRSSRPYTFTVAEDPEVEARLAEVLATSDLDHFLASTETQALIVIEHDVVVLERYANGADRETMLTSFSVAKSFVSTLVGIAIDEGFIATVDDPITRYLPELAKKDAELSSITIADLLEMSSGLEYEAMRWGLFNGDDPLTTYHPDQREVSLEAATRLVDAPGEYFRYNKYHPQLLGMILERTTGMTVTEFTQRWLWDPLGMEFDGEWALDSDKSGFEKMEAGLNARPIDFAKLGSLFLAGGEFNGHRIVSGDWIMGSVSPTAERLDRKRYRDDFGRWIHQDGNGWYGWFWYGRAREGAQPDFFAEGDHGQFIYASPATQTVIVRVGSAFGIPSADWIDAFHRFNDTGR